MSLDVFVYFNAPDPFTEIVRKIEQLLQVQLTKEEDELFGIRYGCNVLSLIITVYNEHGMLDEPDLGVSFSDYQYAIDVAIFIKTAFDESFARATALFIAQRLFSTYKWPCVVIVEDYDKLLELPS